MENDSNENTREEKKNVIPEAYLLALFPACGYAMAYTYESAYCFTFRIPAQFIDVSIVQIIAISVGLLAFSYMVYCAFAIIDVLPIETAVDRAVWMSIAQLTIASAGICLLFRTQSSVLLWTTVAALVILSLNIGLPLVLHRRVEGLENKLRMQEECEDAFKLLIHRIPISYRLLVLAVITATLAAGLKGAGDADYQKEFLVLQPDKVVLRHYGDTLILAKFNRDTKIVEPEFTLIQKSELGSEVSLRLERVGPLKAMKMQDAIVQTPPTSEPVAP